MSSLKFGTSGLRGLVTELGDAVCAAYTVAFLRHLQSSRAMGSDALLLVGHDLRSSSPHIAAACVAAAKSVGVGVENCGPLPTPALALRALSLSVPAIMVTGSHIPADRNGLKFYRPGGEIDKLDEAEILKFLDIGADVESDIRGEAEEVRNEALQQYVQRCATILEETALKGMRVGVYQHSSVARDIIVEILKGFGADAVAIGRSDVFVPVDTEALRPEDIVFARESCRSLGLDAIVSTDGDADRPLIADEQGNFLRGDVIGILTACFLSADAVVTPVTSNTSIERSGFFGAVYRTRVGSPYVIEQMCEAIQDGHSRVVGFEANGGVLLGSATRTEGGQISALPTRDAMLPILSVLGMAAKQGLAISKLARNLPARFTQSGRIEHVFAEQSAALLLRLKEDWRVRSFFADIGSIQDRDQIDGARFLLDSGEVIHYRASGNAPELRCYTEAASSERAAELLTWGLRRAKRDLDDLELSPK